MRIPHLSILNGFILTLLLFPGIQLNASGFFNCDTLVAFVEVESEISCFGGDDGALSVEVSGGTGPYQFFWNTGDTTSVVTGLSAGMYSVNVIDANQCFTIGNFNLQQPPETPLLIEVFDATCGNSDGGLMIEAIGDNDPYEFALNAGIFQETGNFDNLASGVYVVQVADGIGCLSTALVNVSSESSIALDTTGVQMVSCNGVCDGLGGIEILENGSFNTSWYQIDENDGESLLIDEENTAVQNLCAGNYYAYTEGESGGSGGFEEFWFEGFGTGCNQGQLANGFVSDNGSWNTTTTGTNAAQANVFYVSATEQIGSGDCGTGCGGENNRTLHVSNIEISIFDIILVEADGGALYLADANTNIRVESPTIDCSDHFDIELTFDYIEFGQGILDNATLWYFDGTEWSLLDDMAKTACCGGPCNGFNQGQFIPFTINLPPSANNNPDVRIGFNWTNNNDGQGSDPSFAVDNIALSGNADGGESFCPTYSPVVHIEQPEPIELFTVKFGHVTCLGGSDGAIEVQALGGTSPYSYTWDVDSVGAQISDLLPGEYTVTVTDTEGCQASETYTILDGVQEVWADFEVVSIDGTQVTFLNNSSSGEHLWDYGDGSPPEIDSSTNPIHTFPGPGTYQVCLTVENFCGSDIFCEDVVFTPTNIEDMVKSDIDVFPNPASDKVWFGITDSEPYTVSFFDMHSKWVASISGTGSRFVDVSSWPSGVYIWVIEQDGSGTYRYGKLAVE